MKMKIGIDVGNYDTKSQHTRIPSGYIEYSGLPSLANEYLFYNKKYYAPTINRFEYVKDKTENDQALILSLFGIAKEILYTVKQRIGADAPDEDIQSAISDITEISLGIGLPVGDFANETLKDKTLAYYKEKFMDNIVEFSYCGFNYMFSTNNCSIFPQDLLPVAANPNCQISKRFKKYLIMGIGGQTVDLIPVKDKAPVLESCTSMRMGVRRMFSDIISKIEASFGLSIGEDTIEEVLSGEETILAQEVELAIRQAAKDHARSLVNACVQRGINFSEYPVVFFGGGGLLLRPYLENNKQISKSEFLPDVNGNAKFYAARVPD